MVKPVQPYPIKKLNGDWIWVHPVSNREMTQDEVNNWHKKANKQKSQKIVWRRIAIKIQDYIKGNQND